MKNIIHSLAVGLITALFLFGCSNSGKHTYNKLAEAMLASVLEMSPEAIFKENISSGEVFFYGKGNLSRSYKLPGLTEEEIERYVVSKKVPVVIKFLDDPVPIGASKEYWNAVNSFLTKYNRLTTQYLDAETRGQKKGSIRAM